MNLVVILTADVGQKTFCSSATVGITKITAQQQKSEKIYKAL